MDGLRNKLFGYRNDPIKGLQVFDLFRDVKGDFFDSACVTPQCLALGKDSMKRAISPLFDTIPRWELYTLLMPGLISGIT